MANAFLATLNQGDEVIVPAPYWTSYADIVAFCQATIVPVACTVESEFKLSAAQLCCCNHTKNKMAAVEFAR